MNEALQDAYRRATTDEGASRERSRAVLRLQDFRIDERLERLAERCATDPVFDRSLPASQRVVLGAYIDAKRKAADALAIVEGER